MIILIVKYIGAIPDTFCQLTSLDSFLLTSGAGNAGITCAPTCVSLVVTRVLPSTTCPSNQDIGLCGMMTATNIQSITGYSQWSCTTAGITSTTPCASPVWNGLACTGSSIISVTVGNIGLTGNA